VYRWFISYINTPHRPVQVNPYSYGFPSDPGDYGPGEAHYVQNPAAVRRLVSNKFFTRLANDGITPANTLFIITAEEGDHVVAANPTNPGCDGRHHAMPRMATLLEMRSAN